MGYYRQGPFRGAGSGFTVGVPPMTPMVKRILIGCVAVWVVQFAARLLIGSDLLSVWFGLTPALAVRGMIWQPLTYMWLHSPSGLFHIGFNMLILWMVGGDLERRWGGRGFLRYYLVCGLGAAAFIFAGGFLSGRPGIPTIGASGAIYGVLLAFGMLFAERTMLFMLIFPMKARTLAIVLFVIAFVSTLDGSASGVSHVAHLGGMVVGYLYLKRAWRVGDFWRGLRWKARRRDFRVIPPEDDDRWIH